VNILRPNGRLANEQLARLFSLDELAGSGFAFTETTTSDAELWHGSSKPYGHTAHTASYIERVWAQQGFEVVNIVPGAIAGAVGQQDVAVLAPASPRATGPLDAQ
jgi:predicted TPR repeat methyltransferase